MSDAARLLSEARQRAGSSQRALGVRAGVPQSAVSAYESGRVQPSLPVLMRLLEAAGFELEMTLRPSGEPDAQVFVGPVGRRVQRQRRRLREWLETRGFTRPAVFGSVARGDDRDDSDVDLLVDVPDDVGLVGLAGAAREASQFVGAAVDLVPRRGLKPHVAAAIGSELVPL